MMYYVDCIYLGEKGYQKYKLGSTNYLPSLQLKQSDELYFSCFNNGLVVYTLTSPTTTLNFKARCPSLVLNARKQW